MAASLFSKSLCRYFTLKPLFNQLQSFCYKSRYSLDKVYPNSSLDITSCAKVPQNGTKFSGYIPLSELDITYSASSGPGGQNVNKVYTKVDLRFCISMANWIPEQLRPKIIEKYNSLINKDGYLILKSERTRSQMLNLADCLDKLRFIIRDAETIPREPSAEDETAKLKRHEKTCRERLRVKRMRSVVKQGRMAPTIDD